MAPADLQRRVVGWYRRHARELPWRDPATSPWGVLVSEVMLQQTPVVRVSPVYEAWLARWPEPAGLAAASPGEAVLAWGRLGYPRRALRLREAAQVIVRDHAGRVPADVAALRALPGVGEYTAAAVAAFAFGQRVTVLDTNVRRVLARVVDGQAFPPPHLTAAERSRATELLPSAPARAVLWSVGLMELGAVVCSAAAPDCGRCPVADTCRWRAAGRPAATTSRRGQPFVGTDRQVRGLLLGAVRDAGAPGTVVTRDELTRLWPDAGQRERALASLVADGLLEPGDGGHRLPLA